MTDSAPGAPAGRLGQPVVAERAGALLQMIGLGLVSSAMGLACLLGASLTLLRFTDTSRLWPAVANLCAVLVLATGVLQWWVWRQACQEWRGTKDVALAGWLAPSRAGAWLAGFAGLVGSLAALRVFHQTASGEMAHWLSLVGALLLVLGVALAGLHSLNPAGPPGVLPDRMRRNLRLRPHQAHADPDAETLVLARRTAPHTVDEHPDAPQA